MAALLFTAHLNSETATASLGESMGTILQPGDVLLLEGEVGAGKTFFARKLIQSILTTPEDVPSPTFTLVQTYDTLKGEVIHADLYRLSSPDEIVELGLVDAFETSIALIEWPDRLGEETPSNSLTLKFDVGQNADHRTVSILGDPSAWADRIKGLKNDLAR